MNLFFSKKSRQRRKSSASPTHPYTAPSSHPSTSSVHSPRSTASPHPTPSTPSPRPPPSTSSTHPTPSDSSSSPPSNVMSATHSSPHDHEPTTMVESILETTSTKLSDGTMYALSAFTNFGVIDTYLTPVIRYFHALYKQQPEGSVVRLGMIGILVAGAVPVVSLVAAVVMASVGCFVVSGSALLVMETFGLAFICCVLAPAGFLTALTIGIPSLLLYGLYSSVSFLSSLFF